MTTRDHPARAKSFRDDAALLRSMAAALDARAAEEDAYAREAEKRRALDRALADQARAEERYDFRRVG